VKRALIGLLALGCSSTFTAEPADYALYRKTRIAKTSEARLAASHRYLKEQPAGQWREEVKAWFDQAEPLYYQRAQRSQKELQAYLDTLPDGPHARMVSDRILELTLAERAAQRRSDTAVEEAKAITARLEDADLLRREVVQSVARWSGLLSGITTWGQPTSELGSNFIYRFRLEEPKARCDESRCTKSISLSYAVPETKKLRARKAIYDVELELYRGGVIRAKMMGPELFSRAGEASEVRAVSPADPQARAEAIARSVQIVENALDARFHDASCRKDPVSPDVLLKECAGIRIRMKAAPSVEEDDELVVEPLAGVGP
jgi:hypothetical protein